MYPILLFDLDGTLTDSAPGIVACVKYALGKMGVEAPEGFDFTRFVGPPLHASYARYFGFDPEQAARGVSLYRERYRDIGIFENSLYPGVAETLQKLDGYRICLATGKPQPFAERILDHFGIAGHFEVVRGSGLDGSNSTKGEVISLVLDRFPGRRRSDFLMIGDRREDMAGAREQGIDFCAALWGYGAPGELDGADFTLDSIPDLPSALSH